MTTSKVRTRSRCTSAQAATNAIAAANKAAVPLPTVGSNLPPASNRIAVRYLAPEALKAPATKLRKNSDRQRNAVEVSIRQFGFNIPIIIDREQTIVCGHLRWLAARELGLAEVPVIELDHLSSEELRLFRIADNRTAELGAWDPGALKFELTELINFDSGLNLETTGFGTGEIDLIVSQPEPRGEPGEGSERITPDDPVTRPGDLWQAGHHRLLCGNSLERESYETLMGEERAQMIFCDSPYNLPAKDISGLGKVKHDNFAMASGEMSSGEFTAFLTTVFEHMAHYSVSGSIHFQCMDWRHMREMLDAGEAAYAELKNLIVWDKGSGGMGAFFRSQHELIFVWKNGAAKHINNFGLGETGRYRTNVWAYKGNNSFHRNRGKELATHATVKPLALVSDAIRDCSHIDGIILDAFGGSGTTMLAAEHTRRRARMIELEPRFCDAAVLSWQEMTGEEAILAATGQTFAEVAQERGVSLDEDDEAFGFDEDDDNTEYDDHDEDEDFGGDEEGDL